MKKQVQPASESPWDAVQSRLRRLGIGEEDLDEQFILGGGKGGQKVNRTASTVRLFHPASGMEIKCNAERSQFLNRLRARERLCDRLEELREEKRRERAAERARARYRHRKPSRTQKAKRVESKRRRGLT